MDGSLTYSLNLNWPGLVLTGGGSEHSQYTDDEQQNTDGRERVAVRLVEVEHLLYVYIFLKCVKGYFLVSI
jgi:hypothetical protein